MEYRNAVRGIRARSYDKAQVQQIRHKEFLYVEAECASECLQATVTDGCAIM